ncbi:hypothetical protein Mgra_00005851 [Meloidogyne graminicola]|uniref:phosphoethanolamine N-methyltransferase n=1 Tax=Meloidogyne graminicola TaxID=189291 RepID=A0A8S9ZMQ8_9BILA|nr:hypothetical protein Mgra_00005851 [Meloidogyne graminicola]
MAINSNKINRQVYRSFWDKFSDKADNTSMLLNADADNFEALDRAEIIGMLPSFNEKYVVDIGAGIGRFTTEFAKKAKKVVSTDFVASFIEKNREKNASFNNIEWRVGDAVGLEFEEESIDMVFTNWLLMYLSDEEVVQFLIKAIKWLKPGGYLHLRESCSEPSSKKSNNSLHSNLDFTNPTKYRFSSAYINLLKSIKFKNNEGKYWGFKIHWACSVNVYIQKNKNWRQVHWLVNKIPLKGEDQFLSNFVAMLGEKWPEEQKEWDNKLDKALTENQQLSSSLGNYLLLNGIGPNSVVLNFDLRINDKQPSINVHTLANIIGSNIWTISLNPYCYRHSLTLANNNRDDRIRHSWHNDIESALQFLEGQITKEKNFKLFDLIIGVDLLENIKGEKDVYTSIKNILGGFLLNIETNETFKKAIKSSEISTFLPSELFIKDSIPIEVKGELFNMVRIESVKEKRNEKMIDWSSPINGGF